ncbi:sensor histidine kinase [Klenkia terrae]|uniref:sensor histidine kinase n=1 Tax=Klenkia terrae TaxID=1052259 RepID=UPI003614EC2D
MADDQVRVRLSRVVEQLDETVRDIRTTIYDLHDSRAVDPSAGLRRRLREVVTETAGDVLRTAVRTSGAVDSLVTGPLAADVLAVVREGVSNSARHAAARHVTVTVEVTEEVVVEVRDDGRGIDPAVARSGLRNAADRAERRGGSCVAVPLPDGGTALRWRVPCRCRPVDRPAAAVSGVVGQRAARWPGWPPGCAARGPAWPAGATRSS